jgi:hypothetical protein
VRVIVTHPKTGAPHQTRARDSKVRSSPPEKGKGRRQDLETNTIPSIPSSAAGVPHIIITTIIVIVFATVIVFFKQKRSFNKE